MLSKTCTKCRHHQGIDAFSRDASKRDGLSSQCKTCRDAYLADYYSRNRKAICAQRATYREDNVDSIRAMRRAAAPADKAQTHAYRAARPHYRRWQGIRDRCLNPRTPSYSRYGGRGIELYPAWVDSYDAFTTWLEDNLGPCPDGYSLDRIDNDGHYEPGNLRWTDASTQANNRRVARR